MASWTPRQPSPRLKRRLFGDGTADGDLVGFGCDVSAWRAVSTWLMSAAACVAAFMISWVPAGRQLAPALIDAAQVRAFERTPVYASLRTASAHSAANNLPVTSFTWTNQAHAHSTNALFPGDN